MSSLFKIFLAHIPFLDQNVIITNASYNIGTPLGYSEITELSNLSFGKETSTINVVCKVSEEQMKNLMMNRYNALYLTTGGVTTTAQNPRAFKINDIVYASGLNIVVSATEVFYNVVKRKFVSTSANDYANLKAHEAYVRWGYKYDSILKANGKPNFDPNAGTDLYTPLREDISCKFEKAKYAILPYLNSNEDVSASPTTWTTSKWLGANMKFCIALYVQNGTYEDSGTTSANLQGTKINGISLPYTIMCMPIMLAGYKITYNGTQEISDNFNAATLSSILNKIDGNRVLAVKIMPFVPNTMFNGTLSTDGKTLNITQFYSNVSIPGTGTYFGNMWQVNEIEIKYTCAVCEELHGTTNPLPKMTDPTKTFTADDLKSFENPYIAGHTNKLAITDFMGNEKELDLISLGQFPSLTFIVALPWTIESTTYTVNLSINEEFDPDLYATSVYRNIPDINEFNYLIGTFDFGISFSVDQLKAFLGQNKNWYKMQAVSMGSDIGTQLVKDVSNAVTAVATGGATGSIPGGASMFGNAIKWGTKFANINYYVDNLMNAPKQMRLVNSELQMGIMQGFKIFLVWRTASDLQKQNLLNEFLFKGLYLDKYVQDAAPYFQLTTNKFEKRYIKYFEGETELYINQTAAKETNDEYPVYNNIRIIERMHSRGCKLIRYTKLASDANSNVWNETNILNKIDEVTFLNE